MLRTNRERFVEVWDSTNGKDAAVVEALIKNGMDMKYKRFSTGYTYYRLRATSKEIKAFTNQLKVLGYYATMLDNKYIHISYRTH